MRTRASIYVYISYIKARETEALLEGSGTSRERERYQGIMFQIEREERDYDVIYNDRRKERKVMHRVGEG